MADDEKPNAGPPELSLDSKEQGGFINWYKSLPAVRRSGSRGQRTSRPRAGISN